MSNSWFPVTRYYRTGGSKLRSNVQYTLHLDAVWQELVVSCLFCILHTAIFVILNSPPHAASIPQYWFPHDHHEYILCCQQNSRRKNLEEKNVWILQSHTFHLCSACYFILCSWDPTQRWELMAHAAWSGGVWKRTLPKQEIMSNDDISAPGKGVCRDELLTPLQFLPRPKPRPRWHQTSK